MKTAKKIPRRVRVISAYQQVFATPMGKLVLQDMMARFYVAGSTFDPDPNIHSHKEGQREAVLHILSLLNYDERALLAEIEDANKEESEEA